MQTRSLLAMVFSTSHYRPKARFVCSPNDSIRSRQDFWWDRYADLLGGFQIDDELKLHRLFDGDVGGFCP
jgi:hypothetical protein